jgi:hypothetical protein
MKQSTGRLQGARWFTREAGLGVAAAVVAGLAACGGNHTDNCHNVPQAVGLMGQPNFNLGTANTKGVSAATLNAPVGALAIDGSDSYLADSANNRILHYSSLATGINGGADFVIGQPDLQTVQENVATSSLTFANPSKIAIGNSGSTTYMAVADSSNNRVLIWQGLPKSGSTAPVAVLGQPDFTSNRSNNGNAAPTAGSLSNPTSVAIANGFLVVADKGNNRVLIWNSIPTGFAAPADVELGQTASTSAGVVDCTANSGTAGYCFGTNVAAVDQFPSGAKAYTLAMNGPTDVWTNGSKLLVVDTNNHRVLAWNSIPFVNNQLAAGLIGASQFGATSLNGGSGTQALHSPDGVTSDGSTVYVADTVNNRVLEYVAYLSSTPNGPAATYVYGQQDFTHITANDPDQNNQIGDQRNNPVTNGITQGTFFLPQGVTVTTDNQLFITDTANSRVMQFTITKTDGTPTGVDGSDTQDGNFCF